MILAFVLCLLCCFMTAMIGLFTMGMGLGVLDLAGLHFAIPGLHSGFWLAFHVGYGIVH